MINSQSSSNHLTIYLATTATGENEQVLQLIVGCAPHFQVMEATQ